jgi:hypothetical protein
MPSSRLRPDVLCVKRLDHPEVRIVLVPLIEHRTGALHLLGKTPSVEIMKNRGCRRDPVPSSSASKTSRRLVGVKLVTSCSLNVQPFERVGAT